MADMREVGSVQSFNADGPRKLIPKKETFADVYSTHAPEKGKTKNYTKTRSVIEKLTGIQRPDAGGDLTVSTASFNLANNVIGAGLVGLPFVSQSSGVIPFVIFITVAGIGCSKTLDMLASAAVMAGTKIFEGIGLQAGGTAGKWATSFAVACNSYGACIAYLVLISSTAPVVGKLIGQEISPLYLQIGITLVVVLPLTLLKNLNALAASAIFSLIVYLVVGITAVVGIFTDHWYRDVGEVVVDGTPYLACPDVPMKWVGADPIIILSRVPTIIFALACHSNASPVFAELEDGKLSSMKKVDMLSIFMPWVLYTAVGVAGYISYGSNTFSSFLLNMRHCVCTEYKGDTCASVCNQHVCADDSLWSSILNSFFLLAVLTGFPSCHFALRKTMVAVMFGTEASFSWAVHIGIAFFNVALCLFIAVVAKDVSVVFNWAGSIASPLVAFILPGTFYVSLFKQNREIEDPDNVDTALGPVQGWAAAIFGVSMMCLGVGLQLFGA